MSSDLWMTAGRRQPCQSCPWVKDNGAHSVRIPGAHESVAPMFDRRDGFYDIMRCHQVPDEDERGGACIGYLLSEHALDNINVRICYSHEPEVPELISSGRPMHTRYEDMRAALDAEWGST